MGAGVPVKICESLIPSANRQLREHGQSKQKSARGVKKNHHKTIGPWWQSRIPVTRTSGNLPNAGSWDHWNHTRKRPFQNFLRSFLLLPRSWRVCFCKLVSWHVTFLPLVLCSLPPSNFILLLPPQQRLRERVKVIAFPCSRATLRAAR